jgi:phosphatidylinositol glycan class M
MLGGLFFAVYKFEFLEHTFLYHLTRIDHRHNLSPYWLHLCYSSFAPPSTSLSSLVSSLVSFVPQVSALAAIGWRFVAGGDFASSAFGMWAMTVVFVALNKVYTVQYFAWWLILAPLAGLADHGLFRLLRFAAVWVASLALWLLSAYRLEFEGANNSFVTTWLAGLALLFASIEPVVELCLIKKETDRQQVLKPKIN